VVAVSLKKKKRTVLSRSVSTVKGLTVSTVKLALAIGLSLLMAKNMEEDEDGGDQIRHAGETSIP
jgi:hypothetical protein